MRARRSALALLGSLGLSMLAGCKADQRPRIEPTSDAGPAEQAPADAAIEDAVDAGPTQAAQAPAVEPDAGPSLYEQLRDQPTIRPGTVLAKSKVAPPTAEEMSDPRLQHLNEATRRAVIVFGKLQRLAPQLAQPSGRPPGPRVDEAKIVRRLERKGR